MEKEQIEKIVTFDTAKLAKEAGFNDACGCTYNDSGELLARYPTECTYGYREKPTN